MVQPVLNTVAGTGRELLIGDVCVSDVMLTDSGDYRARAHTVKNRELPMPRPVLITTSDEQIEIVNFDRSGLPLYRAGADQLAVL